MQPTTSDIEANEAEHDQLPSVEEAKINNLDISHNLKRPEYAVKYAICATVSALLVLVLLVTLIVVSPLKDGDVLASETEPRIPSNGVVDVRYTEIVQVLKTVSDSNALETQGSPQNLAVNWIAHQDALKVSTTDKEKLTQRYILALFFFAMDGEHWKDDLGFLSAVDECYWNIAEPSAVISDIELAGASCNNKGAVNQLRFPEGYLAGTLPDELSYLTDLEQIDFAKNKGITGAFPSFVRFLPQLNYLGLNHCDFKGSLPDWLGNLSSLQSLILSNNEFTNKLPGLPGSIEYLYLDDNTLSGDIALFGALTNLKILVAEDNTFHGRLSEEMIDGLSNLEILDVSRNQIGSTLPANIWSLKELSVLDCHGNNLGGLIPPVGETHKQLKVLALHDNQFAGFLPSSFTRLDILSHLDLSNNNLASALPESLAKLTDLEYLFVAGNPLAEGTIPSFLSSLTNLKELSLKATNRIGTIPTWMGRLNLKLLDLHGNALTGTIPDSIGEMMALQHLLLNGNRLNGSVPESISKIPDLGTLLLDNNSITGSMDAVCASNHPSVLTADCGGSSPLITCDCCTVCCEPGDDSCNNFSWLGNVEPIWENSYRRGTHEKFMNTP